MGKALIKFFFSALALVFALHFLQEAWNSQPTLRSLALGSAGLLFLCTPILLFRFYAFSCGLLVLGLGVIGIVAGSPGLTAKSAAIIVLAWSLVAWPFVLDRTAYRGRTPSFILRALAIASVLYGFYLLRSSPNFMLAGAPVLLFLGGAWSFLAWRYRSKLAADGDDRPVTPNGTPHPDARDLPAPAKAVGARAGGSEH